MPRNPLNPRGPNKGRKPAVDRLLLKSERDEATGCLLWLGGVSGQMGYGVIEDDDNTTTYVHRLSYALHCGPIPPGHLVLHKCDRPRCFEPSHLFTGTHKQNTADAVAKGRLARGERAGGAKLTTEDVLEIKRRIARRETHESIAKSSPSSAL